VIGLVLSEKPIDCKLHRHYKSNYRQVCSSN